MIKTMEISEISDVEKLISTTISECIDADEDSLQMIIASSIKDSRNWLSGDLPGVHLVHKIDDKVTGMILIKEYWNMASLFVSPSVHGQGIATRLVDEAISICKKKSEKPYIKLNSSSYAAGFYEKYGFKSIGKPRDLPGGCIPYVYYF